MMLAVLLAVQLALGLGLARRLGTFSGLPRLALGVLLGLPASSVVLLVMDLAGIPLKPGFFVLAGAAAAGAAWFDRLLAPRVPWWKPALPALPPVYEWPAIFVLTVLCAVALWRCVLLPVTPRDAIVGMDLVAKFAVAEGTFHSSLFKGAFLEGQLSNQPYYAPFTALMQILYRWALPFGKVWIGLLYSAFGVFLYAFLKERVHAVAAGFLTVALMATQGFFTYAFLVLTDLVNALFFALGVLFLARYRDDPQRGALWGASWFMAFGCWSRSEFILLVPLGAAMVWVFTPKGHRWKPTVEFAVWPLLLFLLWHGVYFHWVFEAAPSSGFTGALPSGEAVGESLRQLFHLTFVSRLLGALPYLFVAALLVDLLRRNVRETAWLLAWMGGLLLMLLFVVHFFPAANLEYTGKRGFLKMLPLMALYLGASPAVAALSRRLADWDTAPPAGGRRTGAKKARGR